VLRPDAVGTERFLMAELAGDYAGLVRLILDKKSMIRVTATK
jgi:hypothetical protein